MKMKIIVKPSNRLILILFAMVFGLSTPSQTLAAGSASFTVSPSSGSYHVGDTVNFSISETSTAGDNVDAVEADLTYNASQLQYQSTSLTGPFTICAKNSGGGGSVNLACASSSTVSGTQLIATITFKVLATGTATISMASTSDIDNTSGTSVWDGITPSSSYALSSSSSSQSSGSSGSSSSSNTCTSQAPSSAPNLYEIDVTGTTATLFFSPAGSPYDSHYISYGQGTDSEGYGANFSTSQSTGALYYVVRELSSNTVYTFKVRGGNGCKPGPWSNTMSILTLTKGSTYTKKFFVDQQLNFVQATVTNWVSQTENFVNNVFPGVPNTGLGAPKMHMKYIPRQSAQKSKSNQRSHASSSLWGNVVNFFTGILHL